MESLDEWHPVARGRWYWSDLHVSHPPLASNGQFVGQLANGCCQLVGLAQGHSYDLALAGRTPLVGQPANGFRQIDRLAQGYT